MRAMAPRTHMPYPCTATSLPLHCVSCVSPQRRATTSSAGLTDICCPSSVQKPHSASLSFSLAWANLRVAPRRPQPPRRPPQARPARRGPPRGRHASEATRTAGRVPCGGVRGPSSADPLATSGGGSAGFGAPGGAPGGGLSQHDHLGDRRSQLRHIHRHGRARVRPRRPLGGWGAGRHFEPESA